MIVKISLAGLHDENRSLRIIASNIQHNFGSGISYIN